MEIFISLYACRSLFTHFVLICVRFVSNFNSKSESHLVSFFRFFFPDGVGVGTLLLAWFGHAMHDTNGIKSLSKYQHSANKKIRSTHTHTLHKENCVPVSYSFFFLLSFILYVDVCNEIRWRFAFDKLLLRYSLSIFHSIFMVSIIGFDDQIMSNRLL